VKNSIRIVVLAVLLVSAFAVVVVKGETPAQAKSAAAAENGEVKIDNFSFGPQILTVSPGTKVTWKNRDDIPHTVVSTEGVFKSRVLDTDETFSFTFDKPGTYPYYCSVHPKMTGQVVVK
jgi:plastocyanin